MSDVGYDLAISYMFDITSYVCSYIQFSFVILHCLMFYCVMSYKLFKFISRAMLSYCIMTEFNLR